MGWNRISFITFVCLSIVLLECGISFAQTFPPLPECTTSECIRQEIQDYVDNLDWGEEFNKITGMSIGGVIALLIVIVIIPNLIILGLIFLCCYCCRCGVFYQSRYESDSPYRVATMNVPSRGVSPKPPVPPKPQSDAPWNNSNQNKSVWPWNRNGSREAHNEGFRTQY